MRFSRTLSGYLLREVLAYTALGILLFAAIFVSQNFVSKISDLIGTGLSVGHIGIILRSLFAMLLPLILPIAFLFGTLVAVGRLSSDSEITAMRACGVGLGELVLPLFGLSLVFSLGMFYLLSNVEPRARQDLSALARQLVSQAKLLQPTEFVEIGDRILFADRAGQDTGLEHVMIWDYSKPELPFVVFAESGKIDLDAETGLLKLVLRNGDVHMQAPDVAPDVPDPNPTQATYRRIAFAGLDYELDVSAMIGNRCSLREQSNAELRALYAQHLAGAPTRCPVKDPNRILITLYQRFMKPIAPMLFALIGIPLGLRRTRGGGRAWSVLLCVLLVFAYYVFMSMGERFAKDARMPIGLALALPNLVFAAIAPILLFRARRDEI